MRSINILAVVLILAATAATGQNKASPTAGPAATTATATTAPAAAATPAPVSAVALTAQDVNAWLDGYMPYALQTGDIAGAVVVVVKDGQILTERGFGYSDVEKRAPVDQNDLVQAGIGFKLLTWTRSCAREQGRSILTPM